MKQYKMKKLQKKYINYRMVEINVLTFKHSLFGIRTKRKIFEIMHICMKTLFSFLY